MSYCICATWKCGFDQAVEEVKQRLAGQGFGVLCDIDVAAALAAKLGVDMAPYRILGACHPPSAHEALTKEPAIGVLLPCNVVVRQLEAGKVEVAAVDPQTAMQTVGNPDLAPLAERIGSKLHLVVHGSDGR